MKISEDNYYTNKYQSWLWSIKKHMTMYSEDWTTHDTACYNKIQKILSDYFFSPGMGKEDK